MSYYDDASLVVIPSGYKTSKVYAEKPTDGSGDLTFTRTGDTATRVNSAGLIEKVRTNLVLQSQTLSVSPTWTPYSGTTVTADAIAAPDGTLTADRIAGTSAAFRGIYQTISSSAVPHTFSVYLKSATGSATTARIWVDSGVSLVNVTTDWQRFSVTATTAASFDVQISTAVSSAIDVYAWGAQLEANDFGATPYILTTTAAVSTGPVANVPRLDYLGSTCPRLLLEPQRTNLALYSEQFNNAAWDNNSGAVLVTANNTIAPDGTQSADKIENNPGSANSPWILQFFSSLSGGQNYVYSIYARAATAGTKRLGIWNNSTTWSYQNISVTTEWKRFEFPFVANAAATQWAVGMEFNTGETEYFVWGCQLEQGAYSTSLIPTLAATATRGADACSKTGISSLIGQTEGTLFAEVDLALNGDSAGILAITGVGVTFIYLFTAASTNVLNANVYTSGTIEANMTYTLPSAGTYKIAVGYKANDFVLYVNGVQRGSDNSGSVPACSDLYIDSTTYNILPNTKHRQALLFKTRLTNSELAELTSL